MKSRRYKKLTAKQIMHLLKLNKQLLEECQVKRIGLFGSYARGEQKRASDIDFIVEFTRPSFNDFMNLAFALEKVFGKKVELITEPGISPHIRPYLEKDLKWHED